MPLPCVYVVHDTSLLNLAVQGILNTRNEFEIVHGECRDLPGLTAEVARVRPRAIIMGDTMPDAIQKAVFSFFREFPGLSIIVLSQSHNWVRIYREENALLTSADHLAEVVSVCINGSTSNVP